MGLTCGLVGSPARGGQAGLAGSRRTTGASRRGTCEAPPIRHGSCRDTFPSVEGGFAPFFGRALAVFPYGCPASRGGVSSVMVERGDVLLRKPTEVTPSPPVMQPHRVWTVRLSPCQSGTPHGPLAMHRQGPPIRSQRGRLIGAARPPAVKGRTFRSPQPPPQAGKNVFPTRPTA